MSRKPIAVLAETHRAAAIASLIAPDSILIRAGERGWKSKWLEVPAGGRSMVIVDDGARIGDLAWAARRCPASRLQLGFAGPRLSENATGDRSEMARHVVTRLGWSQQRQRGRIVAFDIPTSEVTEWEIALAIRLLGHDRDGSPFKRQIGFIGVAAAPFLGDWGRSWYFEPSWEGSLVQQVGGELDLVLVDEDPVAWDRDRLRSTVGEARRLGAHVVGVKTGSAATVWSQPEPSIEVDAEIGVAGSVAIDPGVDVRVINPIGFARESDPRLASVATVPLRSVTEPPDSAPHLPVDIVDGTGLIQAGPAGVTQAEELIRSLRRFRAVIDHPWVHHSESARAQLLAWMACAGVPVVTEQLTDGVATSLGSETARLLAETDVGALDDLDTRERYSIGLRRAALREVSLSARLREIGRRGGFEIAPLPSVSVVMATKRPDYLEHAVAQLAKQTFPDMEIVIALHGESFPDGTKARLENIDGFTVEVLRADESKNLGQVLNDAAAVASGQLISKWDDDDWYGPEHIWDLVLATEYSSADTVGKAAEFVYVADLDITIRRFPEGAESPSRTLAGGTLMLGRDVLRAIGGFPSLPRHVDQALLTRLAEDGGASFRTHGFGYLLNRHGEHTWNVATDYFLDESFRQWRGLRLDEAGCSTESSLTAT